MANTCAWPQCKLQAQFMVTKLGGMSGYSVCSFHTSWAAWTLTQNVSVRPPQASPGSDGTEPKKRPMWKMEPKKEGS